MQSDMMNYNMRRYYMKKDICLVRINVLVALTFLQYIQTIYIKQLYALLDALIQNVV